MQSYEEIEAEVRKLAHSLPPSDFGSTRVIQAVATYVEQKIKEAAERGRRDYHNQLADNMYPRR
jgi:hypothetical protein